MVDILVLSTASVKAINRSIYAELNKRGWRIELVIPKSYPVSAGVNLSAEEKRNGDPSLHVMELEGTNPRTFYFPKLRNLISEKTPKIIFIESDPVSFMAVHVGRICKRHNILLFSLSCENLSFDILETVRRRGMSSFPASIVKKLLYLVSKPLIDSVFTISEDGTKLFKSKGFANVIKVPLGFDPEVFFRNEPERVRIRAKLSLEFPVIAYFGRLVEEKGVDILLNALSKLKQLNWHLMLDRFDTHDSYYSKCISDLIVSNGIQDRVVFIEANHFEIASYMNACDLVVAPSRSTPRWKEQYGRVVPEAMACGKIVIVARSGALPELVGDSGFLFEEGNVDELAAILTGYLDSPDQYNSVSEMAVDRAGKHLSISKQAEIYEESFKRVVSLPIVHQPR